MTTLVLETEPAAVEIACTDTHLTVRLADGRRLVVPLDWFPRLLHGTPEERAQVEISGDGFGIHWPALDEDLHVEALLAGKRSLERPEHLARWLAQRAYP